MDPNNYFTLPQYPIQQQIPIEHLIAANQQQQYFSNNLFATATNNAASSLLMPTTLTPITNGGILPAASTCFIPNTPVLPPPSAAAAAATIIGPPSTFLYNNNNNNFGGNNINFSSLSSNNNITSSSFLQQQQQQQSILPTAAAISSSHQQQQQQQLPFQPSTQPFVQISLSPSIPQPISVIIEGQQYLEFPSSNPGEQSQFIPLQLFLQPQNYISQTSAAPTSEIYPIPFASADFTNLPPPLQAATTMSFISSPPSSQQQQPGINISSSSASQPFVKMDPSSSNSPRTLISPPSKTRRTKSPRKKSTSTTPQTQSSLHKFFSPTSQTTTPATTMNSSSSSKKAKPVNDFSDDDDIQVVNENVTNTNKDIQNPYDYVEILDTSQNTIKGSRPLAAAKSASKMGSKASATAANKSTEDISMTSATTSQSSAASISSSSKPSSSTAIKRPSVTVASSSKFATDLNQSSKRPSLSKTTTAFARPNSSTATVVPHNAEANISGTSFISACSTSSDATSSSLTNSAEQMITTEAPDPLEQRLQLRSALNSRSSPAFDYKMTSEIIREIVPIILEVIPNAIINGIGPAYHECGSFLNLAFDEETHEVVFVWFFFSLSIMIGDKQTKQLQTPDPETLKKWIEKIETRFEEEKIVQHSVIRIQRGAQKLIFEHSKINAKVTLLFCAADACRRSQIIRLYTRFYPRMIQVAYLYNTMILSNPALHLFTNTPLCYMIIYFLQQTDRIDVMHKTAASTLIDKINLFEPPDYRPEDIAYLQKPNPKYINDSVAFLTYEFAKFYASFDYDKIIIDISQKEPRYWSKKDAELKKPIAVRCCFSERNLASQVSAFCLSTFQSKMKEVVEAFKAGKETTVFKSDLEDFAKKFDHRSQR